MRLWGVLFIFCVLSAPALAAEIFWHDNIGACEAKKPLREIIADMQRGTAQSRDRRPAIAIIIDDMGLDRKRSARTLKLPAPVTLAYLPYAPEVQKQVDAARADGHEILVHLPMEPLRGSINPGPDYLGVAHDTDDLRKRIDKNLSQFDGYVGVNNHMGSKFTQDGPRLAVLMDRLKERKLLFIDSKTSQKSIGDKIARQWHVPTTHRDVFIDHDLDPAKVMARLRDAERIALRTGSAVAIGHPKDMTLDMLEKWIPGLAAKGFRLVTVMQVVEIREKVKVATP